MRSGVADRMADFVIAGSLAVFPLLPAGPSYLGLDWPWALEAFFLFVAALGLLFAGLTRRSDVPATTVTEPVRLVRRGYATWLIPVAGATIIGLLARNPLDGVLLGVEAEGILGRLARPMDQAADPFYPLRVGLTYLEGGLAFWLLSAVLTRTSRPGRRIRLAVDGCLAGIALVSVIAIVQYVTGANLHAYWVRVNPELTRSHATLDDPNALASFLVLGIGLAAGAAWAARRGPAGRWWRMGAVLTAGLGCAALVTTVSRAGLLALVIAGIVCATRFPDHVFASVARARIVRRTARGAVALLGGAILLWAIALTVTPKRTASAQPATPWQALVQTVDPRESPEAVLKGRLLLWQAALRLAGADWTIGAGLGQFPRFYATYPQSAGAENAHNFFLQVLAESGVAGLAALGVLLATIALAVGSPNLEKGRRRNRLAAGFSVGVLAFVLTWLTGHPMLTLSNQLWLACVLAVGLAALEPAAGDGAENEELLA